MENFNFNHTNSTTNPLCQHGHEWTFGLNIGREIKNGDPCNCGAMLFNIEDCKCCGQKVSKHIQNTNKMKESIKLDDFLAEAAKFIDGFAEAIKPEIHTTMQCPECGNTSSSMDKFCPRDGKSLEEKKYEVRSEESDREISILFNDLSDGMDLGESFPYEFIDDYETYDDDHSGDKGFHSFVFKRKSDGKHFEYAMSTYGDIEEYELDEVEKKTKTITTWE